MLVDDYVGMLNINLTWTFTDESFIQLLCCTLVFSTRSYNHEENATSDSTIPNIYNNACSRLNEQ